MVSPSVATARGVSAVAERCSENVVGSDWWLFDVHVVCKSPTTKPQRTGFVEIAPSRIAAHLPDCGPILGPMIECHFTQRATDAPAS